MLDGRHDRLSELFERAIELPPDARSHFIEICSDDPAIRAELRSLLATYDRSPNLLERLAGEVLPAALQAVAEDDDRSGSAVRRATPPASTFAQPGAGRVLAPGTRLASYEIQGRIAAGGIGVVYRAFDSALQRPVAIKTLAGSAPDARESLLREARAASALNQPHICTIYEVGEHDGVPFIAMEHIDGRPLGDVIPSDGLPTETVVRYGRQVAEAVEHAHRHGIIHRDLKSANVMVSAEGRVKVLDFGLARRLPAADMETLTYSRIGEGSAERLAGTLAYLAPELLRGSVADKRSDVWALGVLLYEIASGRLPFRGSSPIDLTAAILDGSPAPLPPKLPMPLRAVIGKCLARDPVQRYQHAGEVRVALETLQLGSDPSLALRDEVPGVARHARWWRGAHGPAVGHTFRRSLLAVLLLTAILTGVVSYRWVLSRRSDLKERPLTSNSSEVPVTAAAISPDGKYIAYADANGIHLRLIASGETHGVANAVSNDINRLAWFPDGSTLLMSGTSAPGTAPSIWAVSILGGEPRRLRDDGMEASVSPDGSQIAFIDRTRKAVWLMGASGDEPHRVVVSGGEDTFHVPGFPWTGARVTYGRVHLVRDTSAGAVKFEVSAESCDREGRASAVLISDPGLRAGVSLPDGRFIYSLVADAWWNQGGTSLWEIRTDPGTGRPAGEPRRLHDWERGSLSGLSVTADGKHVAFTKAIPQSDVYVADLEVDGHLNSPRRLTLDDSNDFPTNWTPDSTAVFFSSDRNGNFDIFKQALNGRAAETIVAGPEDEQGPTGVSPDGAWLYYVIESKGWRLTMGRPLTVMRSASTGGLIQRVFDQLGKRLVLCSRSHSTGCVVIEQTGTQLAVYSLDLLAGRGRKLASTETAPGFPITALAPDGSRLAVVMDAGRVRLLSLGGEPAHDVLIGDWSLDRMPFYWAADGKGWYMSSSSPAGTDLLRVDLNGHAEVLRHQAVQQNANAAVPSPDGRHVAFTEMTSVSNVWTIEKF